MCNDSIPILNLLYMSLPYNDCLHHVHKYTNCVFGPWILAQERISTLHRFLVYYIGVSSYTKWNQRMLNWVAANIFHS